ncbi:MAG: hypothetical protein ACFWT5_06085 [Pseudomonas helleri]
MPSVGASLPRDLLIFNTHRVGADEARRLRAFHGCFATGRSLAKLVNCYRDHAPPLNFNTHLVPQQRLQKSHSPVGASLSRDLLIFYTYLVGADEVRRLRAFYGCFATGRSLAKLVNCYRDHAASRDLLIFNTVLRSIPAARMRGFRQRPVRRYSMPAGDRPAPTRPAKTPAC